MNRTLRILHCFAALALCRMAAAEIDFSHDIVPIIRQNCSECHAANKKKGGFSLNTREDLIKGGESGAGIVPGKSSESALIARVTSKNDDERMPPPGPNRAALKKEDAAKLKAWIDSGAKWEDGFSFMRGAYEPPLKPRRPDLPAARRGHNNPVDRIVDANLDKQKISQPKEIDDATFLRRVYLDLIGLLPDPETREKFLADKSKTKREQLIQTLLASDIDYAEHWLTFWNDLLRNDYVGTGYIDGGRKDISQWLYKSLVSNKPYDQFARELLAPTPESEGFARGIKWRGNVSAGQLVPVQFAQSVGQTFLGINLKCASCHDSFIDRWKLDEAYGIAAVYSPTPLEIHRCDKPTGRTAQAAWIFPELGTIDASKPPPERLKQLAGLMTHPENGRFTRTIVNRLWHRLMGRGIVHPVDAMQTEPWSADLLDFLATDLADKKYDLKKTIELICKSAAYQSRTEIVKPSAADKAYVYAGPRARRLSAEQFTDAIWQITETAPKKIEAPITRGKADPKAAAKLDVSAKWIWSDDGSTRTAAAGETITLEKVVEFLEVPARATAAVTCDNSFILYVNKKKAGQGDNWEAPETIVLDSFLKKGANEFLVVAKNAGSGPNPAALLFEAHFTGADGKTTSLVSDENWSWTSTVPSSKGVFTKVVNDWKPAVPMKNQKGWDSVMGAFKSALAMSAGPQRMVRASLMRCDLLMRTLGRPNREQIVSMRPTDLTTLEAMDLNNGQILNARLRQGAEKLAQRNWDSSGDFAKWLYVYALSRPPTDKELSVAREILGAKPAVDGMQDLMWAVFMLPEFQLVR